MRRRDPAHISTKTNDFGQGVSADSSTDTAANYPSGRNVYGKRVGYEKGFREVIPEGEIGSVAGDDRMEPAPQTVDTVAMYPGESRDPRLHDPIVAIRDDEKFALEFHNYDVWEPRRAPMPRTAGDEGFLEAPPNLSADPLMTDGDSNELFWRRPARTKDLYGENKQGMLHNEGHPGFKAVQGQIEKEGYSKESAGAILASRTRHASAAAKKANPHLKRVKG